MSSVLKKADAESRVFKYKPKNIQSSIEVPAKEFVQLQDEKASEFRIADVVAQKAGIETLRRKNLDERVEETIRFRLKDVQEEAYKQAYELGLLDGREKAFEDARAIFEEKLKHFDSLIVATEQMKSNVLKQTEAVLMRLVFKLGEKIAVRAIQMDQAPLLHTLNELVQEVQNAETITVKMNPEDMNFIEELRQKKVKEAEPLERVKFVGDAAIQKGGCVIETNYGAIISTIPQRIEKAWSLIEGKLPIIKHGGS